MKNIKIDFNNKKHRMVGLLVFGLPIAFMSAVFDFFFRFYSMFLLVGLFIMLAGLQKKKDWWLNR